MEELRQVLMEHAKRYPAMQPTDAVKLIYQNEFGGGHMIRDEVSCLTYLRQEYEITEKNLAMSIYEPIGNGMVRVNLAAVAEENLEQLGKDFIRSAAIHRGTIDSFISKLSVLSELTQQGAFAFGTNELDAYLAKYEQLGYPAVSHSEEYRQAYRPAYRIVRILPDARSLHSFR